MLNLQFTSHAPVSGPPFLDLLESLAADDRELAALHSAADGRWSVIALDPMLTIEFSPDGTLRCITHGAPTPATSAAQNIPEAFDALLATVHLPDSPIPGAPLGWLGLIGYEIGRHLENIGPPPMDDMQFPLLRWSLYATYYLLDHQTNLYHAIRLGPPGASSIPKPVPPSACLIANPKIKNHATLRHQTPPADYRAKVQRVIDYIAAGDVYQVNLAQRWLMDTAEQPERIFRNLCAATPAPYAAFFRFGDHAIASASPELFVERRGAVISTRPIKGTRPRHADPVRDAQLRDELLASPKDRAELAMIVDLMRNDLGRICDFRSIQITDPRKIEPHPTVWHTVATIAGRLREDCATWGSIVAALCPGGSVTGAPKIRAMQIIRELEQFSRGAYCGNMGWIGSGQTGALSIAIRTIQLRRQATDWRACTWAGGGIVADSLPAAEHAETLDKVAALHAALGLALDR